MFTKIFKYKIKHDTFDRWKKIVEAIEQIYLKYGKVDSEMEVELSDNFVNIVENHVYENKEKFEEIKTKVEKDSKHLNLLDELRKLVIGNTQDEEM